MQFADVEPSPMDDRRDRAGRRVVAGSVVGKGLVGKIMDSTEEDADE